MKKNFGNDVASAMSKSLFKNASVDELLVEDKDEVEGRHMHDANCADDCETSVDSNMASDEEDEESPMDKKEAAFQLAVDSLLSASAYLEAMAEERKSDFILKVAAKLVKEKDDKVKAKKELDKQKASDKKDKEKEKAAKDKQKAKDQALKEKEKAAKEKEKEKAAKDKQKASDMKEKAKLQAQKEKDKLKASDKKDDKKKEDKKDEKSDKKKDFKDFIKSKKKD